MCGVALMQSFTRTVAKRIVHSRLIHARAQQMPFAERLRKQLRPLENFRSPGVAGMLTKEDSRTILSPTTRQRSKSHLSEQRRQMQMSQSPTTLLLNLNNAIQQKRCDSSVFGSAMQRCGQERWWDCLQQIRRIQQQSETVFDTILLGQYLSALAKCVRGEEGFGVLLARQSKLIPLAGEAWEEAASFTEIDRVTLGAAFTLCATAAAPQTEVASLHWAENLHKWAMRYSVPLDVIHYASFARVLEIHHLPDRVDKLLLDSRHHNWTPNAVVLGGLINAAAENYDWQRAERLWDDLISKFGVQPNSLCYVAMAKAHLFSGRPAAAAHVVDDMLIKGMNLGPEAAELQIQAILILYHSTLSEEQLRRLEDAFQRGSPLIEKASSWQIKTLKRLCSTFCQVRSSPASVKLHDVLVEWKATRSKMVDWPNHSAGDDYLSACSRLFDVHD